MPRSSPRDGAPKPKKLLDQVRDRIRLKNYSYRTEKSYVSWIKRYILFHDKQHPTEMDRPEIEEFLTHLAVVRNVAPSTQNQALLAILFLYRDVLEQPINGRIDALRAQERRRLPVVLMITEVASLLSHLSGVCHLAALLLYGSGLRVRDCLSLRVKDVDIAQRQLIVRAGKGDKDRITVLPERTIPELETQLQVAGALHDREWGWQFIFPSSILSRDPQREDSPLYRFHLHKSVIQRAVRTAAQ